MDKIRVDLLENPPAPPHVASMSPALRLLANISPVLRIRIGQYVASVAYAISQMEGVVESLKRETIPGEARAMRQLDIKDSDEKVQFKTFTCWLETHGCLCVLIEFGTEDHWETTGA